VTTDASFDGTVAVVGLGYIGLPLVRAFVDGGLDVLGVDVDPVKVERLLAGEDYLTHLGEGFAARLMASGRFTPTADESSLARADAVVLCVPTPLGPDREPDLSYVRSTAEAVARHLAPGGLVVLVSTTWPGTTREVVLPILEGDGARGLGRDLFVAYSPEREDPGRKDLTTATIPRLVGGLDDASRERAVALFSRAVQTVVPVRSAEVAEAAKLLENIYRAVNVSMVNEMKTVLTALGLDVHEVVDAAATKPFGFQPFRPGPGMGGHCLPIDPFYLAHRARQAGVTARFIELAGEVDRAMPAWVVTRLEQALAERDRPLQGARILLLGLAYKADVDDVRESPAFVLIERLEAAGATVEVHDPHVPATHAVRHATIAPRDSVPLTAQALEAADAVLVATDHRAIDWDLVAAHARLVVDTRGVLRDRGDHVIQA
jgi:UDP-N-acetyl-D-glucosamine dehydrogenase